MGVTISFHARDWDVAVMDGVHSVVLGMDSGVNRLSVFCTPEQLAEVRDAINVYLEEGEG